MPRAEFSFSNLPAFLSGSASGVVSGTPDITGTFRFTVSYTDGENSGEEEQFLSVTASPIHRSLSMMSTLAAVSGPQCNLTCRSLL